MMGGLEGTRGGETLGGGAGSSCGVVSAPTASCNETEGGERKDKHGFGGGGV